MAQARLKGRADISFGGIVDSDRQRGSAATKAPPMTTPAPHAANNFIAFFMSASLGEHSCPNLPTFGGRVAEKHAPSTPLERDTRACVMIGAWRVDARD